MPLQATSGAASYDGFGGGVAAVPNYIEDVFSTYLYTGTGANQTITNNIDLSTKGGLTWIKIRDGAGYDHALFDTARGANKLLSSNQTAAQAIYTNTLNSFNTTGFSLGIDNTTGTVNQSGNTYVSWTFRKQPKFFDVVTYTGTGSVLNVSHNLGSVPGCIIIKRTSLAADWVVYHRSTGNAQATSLNTSQAASASTAFNSTDPTSTVFTLGAGGAGSAVNANGQTYVAYLFAHNAGGFGLTGTDNVISCGSFTTDVNGSATVSLGYEPQWFLVKQTSAAENWFLYDTMRGFANLSDQVLFPNLSNAESNFTPTTSSYFTPTATGVSAVNWFGANSTYIYIAIRRGPMKVPTSGTSVFSPNAYAGTSSAQTQTTNFPVDLFINKTRNAASDNFAMDRLRGSTQEVETNTTAAESSLLNIGFDSNTGVKFLGSQLNGSGSNFILWSFRRAPSFFDEVCYTGNNANQTIPHNLTVAPELWIVKERTYDLGVGWAVYAQPLTALKVLFLNNSNAQSSSYSGFTNGLTPTASNFYVGTTISSSGNNYVAYLFATCPGVSKVGSYTGNGSTQTINCGFTGGARFVLIKRTDSTGDWYVWDTARGIVTANDPHLSLNTTVAEVTTDDTIDTDSTGFVVNQVTATNVNVSSATYIYLAIA